MARVVCVHGIAQEYEAKETLHDAWAPALCGGVSNAGGSLTPSDIDMAFYGILFRPAGKGDQIPEYVPGDLTEPFELELLQNLAEAAAAEVTDPDATKGIGEMAHRAAAPMLRLLTRTPFFGDVAQKVVIWFLKQVQRYFSEPEIRAQAQQAFLNVIREDTRVVVGHSLGSVVAYEVLCAKPELPVRTLVTLGSPLGVPALMPRLVPPVTPPGHWPAGIQHWFNIADSADLIALQKQLSKVFGSHVVDSAVHNGATMHNVKPYLTARETGSAIITGLKES